MDWAVIIPAWGLRHVELLERVVLPGILAAAHGISGRLRFIVHTDRPDWLAEVFGRAGQDITLRPLPMEHPDNFHLRMSVCHRQALAEVVDGECVALINGDMVPSVEAFSAAEKRFVEGKRLVISNGIRTLAGREPPPIGARSADLLKWCWTHPHTWTTDCIFDRGYSRIPSVLFFERGQNVIMHAFHLHPFAFVKDRPLTFGTTADLDLAELFTMDEMHIVTSADELSFAEISPLSRDIGRQVHKLGIETVAKWASHTLPLHQWQFTHPIAIIGDGSDIGDRDICAKILEEVTRAPPPVRSRWQRRRRH